MYFIEKFIAKKIKTLIILIVKILFKYIPIKNLMVSNIKTYNRWTAKF